jgi:hypothetical protein
VAIIKKYRYDFFGMPDPINEKVLVSDYHQTLFAWLNETYASRLMSNQLERPLELRKREFFAKLTQGPRLEGEGAWQLCWQCPGDPKQTHRQKE